MKAYFSHDEGARNASDRKYPTMPALGEDYYFDRSMALATNRYLIQRQIEKDPALAEYNTPEFIAKAARWSFTTHGWGISDLEGFIEYINEKKINPMRLYHSNVKLWNKMRKDIFTRDNYTCYYCGVRGGVLEVDHIHPVSKGGNNDYGNLATACLKCNRSKRDKTVEEFRQWQARKGLSI